ncbi:MAG: glycosyltransferase family 4 protein [Hyphomicrobiaceae bacterium]
MIALTAPPPTILQIVPELETGGAELSAVEMAEAITRAGGRALVASQGGRMEDALAAAGGELIRMPVASKNPLQIWRNGQAIAGIIVAEDVSLLHARSRAPAWSAEMASRKTDIPFITTYHGAYGERSAIKRLYNHVMVRGELVIANSEYTARLIETRYQTPRSKIRVIHRGVDAAFNRSLIDDARIRAIRQRWGVAEGLRIVLLAGRLTSWKGQQVLIEAFAELDRNNNAGNAIVVLAGDHQGRDAYRESLIEQISAAGLDDRVLLVGHESDMPGAFAAAHIAVVSSTEPEAFGRTAVEAQAMGCPVIATRHGAPPETVIAPPEAAPEQQTGWLSRPGDADDLARHLAEALALPEAQRQRMGDNAQANVRANFTSALMKSKTLVVYNEVFDQLPAGRQTPRFRLG